MAITKSKPPIELSVGGIYVCFDQGEDTYSGEYEQEVSFLETVKTLHQTDEYTETPIYASGEIYDTDETITSSKIETSQIAWPPELLAKMRGDRVEGGLVFRGTKNTRPFFAVGYVVELKGGKKDLVWNPKCKLSNDDSQHDTKTNAYSERTVSLNFTAYPYNSAGDYSVTAYHSMQHGYTEETFFAAPVLEPAGN